VFEEPTCRRLGHGVALRDRAAGEWTIRRHELYCTVQFSSVQFGFRHGGNRETIVANDSVRFSTTLMATGNNTGIFVPPEALQQLGAGKRPAVVVGVNGYTFECTIGSMGGRQMIAFSAARRKDTGLAGGDPIDVTLTLAAGPRDVVVPADFRNALRATKGTEAFFAGLSNSMQRYHVDQIEGAKTPETRQRRIDKAVALFVAGKPR
jgi:hypothetical protein